MPFCCDRLARFVAAGAFHQVQTCDGSDGLIAPTQGLMRFCPYCATAWGGNAVPERETPAGNTDRAGTHLDRHSCCDLMARALQAGSIRKIENTMFPLYRWSRAAQIYFCPFCGTDIAVIRDRTP